MGKKNHKKEKSPNASANSPVSLITVNQYKRSETIKILFQHIQHQTYKNIVQWVIVEGSPTAEEAKLNTVCISELTTHVNTLMPNLEVTYLEAFDSSGNFNSHKLGQLRNIGNNACIGDITVCMDDDDYYFPARVEDAVERLQGSKCLIAGCSPKYLYDFGLGKLLKFKEFAPYHSTNDCMAWKKEFITSGHSHDPTAINAEESSFTKNFSAPMVQLDAAKCIIGSSHHMNTFNKKEICVMSILGIYPKASAVDSPHVSSSSFMGKDIYEQYISLYIKPSISPYDIVYFTGGTSIDWQPQDNSLGGSEQAVVHLATMWANSGKKVAVYGKVPTCTYKGVEYIDWKLFDYTSTYKIIIMWRLAGIHTLLPFDVKTDKLYWDLHDNFYQFRIDLSQYMHKIDKIFFKSDYHLESYKKHLNKPNLDKTKYEIIPNGIRVSDFTVAPPQTPPRNPYRFCYCSCYTRGLMEILMYIWPLIYNYEPRAELHVYYGMNTVHDQKFVQHMAMLLSQPGVMDHGRQPMEMIIREKWMSTFHLYITDTDAEIDCISIRESLCTGCIPILSKSGVFAMREGLHFELDKKNIESYKIIVHNILQIIQKHEFTELCRIKFSKSSTIVDWQNIALQWLNVM